LAEPEIVSENRNQEKIAEMVKLIAQRGPKVDEIARVMGVYNETVRYWYRQLLSRGFAIQASCNYEYLGMKRVVVIIELGDLFKDCADTVFYAMGHQAYVVGYAKTKLGGYHVLSASVPQDCLNSWTDFMLDLKKIGVFKSIESIILDWVRNVPMRAEYFNFENGDWEFDWKSDKVNPVSADVQPSQKQKYDSTDLKIIGQLQVNANLSLTEMCEKVGAKNYKTFAWHYKAHVFRKGMIKGYRVNWTGMKYDFGSDRLVHKRHRYSWIDVIANGPSEGERLRLMATLNQTPFVWIEGSGARAYFARMVFPAEEMSELLELLETAVSPVREKVKWFHMDQAHALSFSLPIQYYDEGTRRWNFNKQEVLQGFETLQRVRHEIIYGHLPSGRKRS
jgi:DNA-binding Lrp family transcriptional regulator